MRKGGGNTRSREPRSLLFEYMEKNILEETAKAILQRETTIKIGKDTYQVAPPTIATLIEVSSRIAKMDFDEPQEEETQLNYVLRNARKAKCISEILALLILGEQKAFTPETWTTKIARLFRLEPRKAFDQLTRKISTHYTPDELLEGFVGILSKMEVESFFAISTFLKKVNVVNTKKKVD